MTLYFPPKSVPAVSAPLRTFCQKVELADFTITAISSDFAHAEPAKRVDKPNTVAVTIANFFIVKSPLEFIFYQVF